MVRDVIAGIDHNHVSQARWCNECVYYCNIGDGAESDWPSLVSSVKLAPSQSLQASKS